MMMMIYVQYFIRLTNIINFFPIMLPFTVNKDVYKNKQLKTGYLYYSLTHQFPSNQWVTSKHSAKSASFKRKFLVERNSTHSTQLNSTLL